MGLIIQFVRRKLGFHGRFLLFSHKLLTFEQRIFAGVLIDILFDPLGRVFIGIRCV